MSLHKSCALAAGPIVGATLGAVLFAGGLQAAACWCAALTVLCALWWIFEPIPIPATSIIPFAVFPLVGVMDHAQVAACFGHPIVLLVIGGLMLSVAMEKSGAHRRVAFAVVRVVGGQGGCRVVLGFVLASALVSMWMSNIATTLILLPVAMAVLEQAEDKHRLAVPLLLGVAYGATVGGMGTPIGAPPNLIFLATYQKTIGVEIGFWGWMKLGVPMMAVMLPIVWLWLSRNLRGSRTVPPPQLGPWQTKERRVMGLFALTALAWMTRTDPMGGWVCWFDLPDVGDSTVALAAVTAMFVIPDGSGGRLLDWQSARNIPWGILLLFAGSLAIAAGFETSGLGLALGNSLVTLGCLPVVLMIVVTCLIAGSLTEVTSNTATAAMLMPVLASAATAAHVDPLLLLVPTVISSNCSFMLPAATGPNAVVFASGEITVREMAREGLVLHLISVPIITLLCYVLL